MRKKKLDSSMYVKYIDAMLELILDNGGLKNVNLRMVSKHIGCAHTNAYNYFENFDALIYAAYDKTLTHYASAITNKLHHFDDANQLFIQFIENIASFAINYPGYYRFIGSDDFKIEALPPHSVEKARQMKKYFEDLFFLIIKDAVDRERSDNYANIIMAYIDGELHALINKRVYPDENITKRLIKNTKKLVELFILETGIPFKFVHPNLISSPIPKLDFTE